MLVFLESSIRLSGHHSSEKQRQGSNFSHCLMTWELMKTSRTRVMVVFVWTHLLWYSAEGLLCLDEGQQTERDIGLALALSSWPFELESLPRCSSVFFCAITSFRT